MRDADEEKADYPDYVLARNQVASEENLRLFKAALAGSITGVREALNEGGKPNYFYRPEDSKNSLHVAAENGYAEVCEMLLNHGAVVDR